MVSVQTRLEQARYAIGRGVTQRRACTLMNVARSGLVYECKMPVRDGSIIETALNSSSNPVLMRVSGHFMVSIIASF